jgi:endonuclease/exonuclease/phosphatase family metal-dependent hydrolase
VTPFDLRVATWNLANLAQRWPQRRPLVEAVFREVAPGLCGLQEVALAGERQDELLARALGGHPRVVASESDRFAGFGNVIIAARGEVLAREEVGLGQGRKAHRVLVALPGGRVAWFANTHLYHREDGAEIRRLQAERLAAWMDEAPRADVEVVAGDFNAPPTEAAYGVMEAAGFRSAFRMVHGSEPASTRLALDGAEERPACVDYLWIRGAARVERAWLAGTAPAPGDGRLFASDHALVAADIRVG